MKPTAVTFLVLCMLSFAFLAPDVRADYYGSRTSNKYHYKSCPYFPQIKPSNRLVFETPEQAAGSGYIACPVCRPPKPAPGAKDSSAGKPSEPAKQNEPVIREDASGRTSVKIRMIKFEKGVDGMERVAVYLDQFYLPETRVLEGAKPLIHLYFRNGSPATEEMLDSATDGNFVKRIRVQKDEAVNRLIVILEMEPNQTFFVNPFFYEEDNVYLLEITKVKKVAEE